MIYATEHSLADDSAERVDLSEPPFETPFLPAALDRAESASGMSEIRVITVDNDAIYRAGIRLLLNSGESISVVDEATDGIEAIVKVAAKAPDIIILNLEIPNTNIEELITELSQRGNRLKVLGMSHSVDLERILEALNSGLAGYLPRQARLEDLVQAINAIHDGGVYLHSSFVRLMVESYGKESGSAPGDLAAHDAVSPREQEVLRLIGEGLSNRQIAVQLGLSVKTVERHAANIMDKLGIHRRTELVRYAIGKGIVTIQ